MSRKPRGIEVKEEGNNGKAFSNKKDLSISILLGESYEIERNAFRPTHNTGNGLDHTPTLPPLIHTESRNTELQAYLRSLQTK